MNSSGHDEQIAGMNTLMGLLLGGSVLCLWIMNTNRKILYQSKCNMPIPGLYWSWWEANYVTVIDASSMCDFHCILIRF
jgi:hypothetical protein